MTNNPLRIVNLKVSLPLCVDCCCLHKLKKRCVSNTLVYLQVVVGLVVCLAVKGRCQLTSSGGQRVV